MVIECLELNWLCKHMKKVRSSQAAVLILNWVKQIRLIQIRLIPHSHAYSLHSHPDSLHPPHSHPHYPHSHPDSPHSHPDSLHSHPDSPHSHHSFHSVPRFHIPVFTDSWGVQYKKVSFKISQNSQENTCARVSDTGAFLWILSNF